MEFGKTDIEQAANTDFTLPAEPAGNRSVLGGKRADAARVFVGCARWGTKEWLGHFYPDNLREKDFLHYYARLFNTIELNTTYYRIPDVQQVLRWKSQVGPEFRFCPKFPQYITHDRKLQHCDRESNEFLQSISAFGENLGPTFLMPHPQMSVAELPVIERFAERLPDWLNVFIELRHPSWFANGLPQRLLDFAAGYNIGIVITDTAGRRDCVHMNLTGKQAFIRFVGNDLHPTDYTRVRDWKDRIGLWLSEGLETVYFFMHQHNERNAALLNQYVAEQFNTLPGVQVQKPLTIQPQATLFD